MDQATKQRFAIALGIAKNTTTEGGRRDARQLAVNVAGECGLTIEAALATLDEDDRAALAGVVTRTAPLVVAEDDEPALALALDAGDVKADADDDDDDEAPELVDELPDHPSTAGDRLDAAIAAALVADPNRSDRDIAREVGCSPTTVGRARAAAGLAREARVVHRAGGQRYEMQVGERS